RRAHGPMVSVVEQQLVSASLSAMPTDSRDELRVVPFVHDGDVDAVQGFVEIDGRGIMKGASQLREGCLESLDGLGAALLAQIAQAPAVPRLEHSDVMPARE